MLRSCPAAARCSNGAVAPELAEQIAAQERFFAPLIVEPAGVTLARDELGGVPVEWTTPAGHRCLGVFVDGVVNDVDVQWRYYRIAADGMPQTTISVTVEQSVLDRFADADRPLVDSLELLVPPAKTAAAETPDTK